MVTSNKLVSLITINYNSTDYTLELLKSLECSEYQNFEVIVVDNFSKEDPKNKILSAFPKTVFYRSESNLGFAGGNNKGIELASGDFLFFINNDTEVTPTLIGSLVESFQKEKNLGMISPKIVYFNTDVIQYAGYTEISNLTARNAAIGNGETDSDQFKNLLSSPYAHGAAMMTTKSVIEKCGKMPEVYFLYYEELDWCEIIRKTGYNIMVDQSAVIYHKESMSIGKNSPLKSYYLTRNRILFFRRNKKATEKLIFFSYFLLLVLPVKSVLMLLKRDFQILKVTWKGVLWHLRNLKYAKN